MKLFIQKDLLIIDICIIILILITTLADSEILHIILGLPFALFFPGYSLVSTFFLRKNDASILERLTLSLGLSIVLVSIAGLCLNYTPWGIRLNPLIVTIAVFTFITSSIAWYRRLRVPAAERAEMPTSPEVLRGKRRKLPDKLVSLALTITILAVAGTLIYVVSVPGNGEKYTEFYLVDNEQATDYTGELSVGVKGEVVLGIVNREQAEVDYRIEVKESGETIKRVGPVILQHEQKWEQSIEFVPERPGNNQKLEFFLFKGKEDTRYRSVHIWVDVGG
jgi:uncharacterized membrane protein